MLLPITQLPQNSLEFPKRGAVLWVRHSNSATHVLHIRHRAFLFFGPALDKSEAEKTLLLISSETFIYKSSDSFNAEGLNGINY